MPDFTARLAYTGLRAELSLAGLGLQVRVVNAFAALAAAHIPLAPNLRMNVMGSYQSLDYADSLLLAGIGTYNHRAWSGAANLFYSPVRNVDVGVEYRHAVRTLVNGAEGTLDQVEFAAKYNF